MANAGDYTRASDVARDYCKASQSSVQSIPNAAFTALQFNATDAVDTLGIHDPVTNNSRFTIGLKLGWWLCSGKYVMAGTAAGLDRRGRFLLNGVTSVDGSYSATPTFSGTAMTGGFWTLECTSLVQSTAAADYVEMTAFQSTGGAQNTTISGDLRSQFFAIYLGP